MTDTTDEIIDNRPAWILELERILTEKRRPSDGFGFAQVPSGTRDDPKMKTIVTHRETLPLELYRAREKYISTVPPDQRHLQIVPTKAEKERMSLECSVRDKEDASQVMDAVRHQEAWRFKFPHCFGGRYKPEPPRPVQIDMDARERLELHLAAEADVNDEIATLSKIQHAAGEATVAVEHALEAISDIDRKAVEVWNTWALNPNQPKPIADPEIRAKAVLAHQTAVAEEKACRSAAQETTAEYADVIGRLGEFKILRQLHVGAVISTELPAIFARKHQMEIELNRTVAALDQMRIELSRCGHNSLEILKALDSEKDAAHERNKDAAREAREQVRKWVSALQGDALAELNLIILGF